MIKGNKEKPPPTNNSEILRVCIQLYSYHDRRINETALSVGELYHKIFGNDGRLEFNSFKIDIEWLNSNGLISLNNNAITIDKKVAKTLIDYVFEHKAEI
jgi:hypothetical protein